MTNGSINNIVPSMSKKRFETKEIAKYRKALLSNVTGEILELGIGTGVNLQYYPNSVKHITAVDQKMKELRRTMPVTDHYYSLYHELPFDEDSFDTVVATFTLGNVIDLKPVLDEIRRVLRPRGRFLFMESGRSVKKENRILQDVVNPLWEIFGGKVINRDYFEALREAKFLLANQVQTQAIVEPKRIYGTLYTGIAVNVK